MAKSMGIYVDDSLVNAVRTASSSSTNEEKNCDEEGKKDC